VESIFNSWPLATAISIIVALFVFREPLAELIGRIRAFKVAGHSVDASADLSKATSEQQEKVEPPTARATIPATHALPPPSDVYAPFEQHIRNGMGALNLPADVEKAWLIRLLAQCSEVVPVV
jgi:hypothetical protein